ncbi:hypothetical protein ASPZODRAFT_126498 [Penicilliopsis zonata CBS 506.65]|uniref:Zn(2)-C6 fungal-type domain-containing protein n=1 Tax=Penicilliopsis zonata CBS 506.65 TaxID=1073090 RepID=A0A1L9STZ9_9EURO|nr:hypothetical protein ASPZODRAFT_126498 [Penicilliopsis zonata CBS 506.65]OJJ50606.1 hypothetical protein ASPZODRAFT_126498 [Penicilliopsis zonata CBS 506.65]
MASTTRRTLRRHKKSRNGCRNCKLRSVKCDETKPGCRQCIAYGVTCNYDDGKSDLQVSTENEIVFKLPPSVSYWPNQKEQILDKFQMRTALTISAGRRLQVFQKEIVALARTNPILMDAISTLTLMHERYLTGVSSTRLSTSEAYHWYRALSAFNSRLLLPLRREEYIPLWTVATIFSIIVYTYPNADTPEQAWPLRAASTSDLDWLLMNTGKHEVHKLAGNEWDADPVFQILSFQHEDELLPQSPAKVDFESIPKWFSRVFHLDGDSDSRRNPYHTAAIELAEVLDRNCPVITTILSFAAFRMNISHELQQLLLRKDPRALLLLACWYAKVCNIGVWWLTPRAVLEGQAICRYLEEQHGYDMDIQLVLQFPKSILFSSVY